jgi:dienelactone hydrolase
MSGQGGLPGTKPLTTEGDLAAKMVAGLREFMLKQIEASVASREKLWQCDFSSPEAYARSVAPNRERLKQCIGAVDPRQPATGIELVGTMGVAAKVAEGAGYAVYAVRWPVLDGVDAEGLLLQPAGERAARIIAIPDADWTPEMLVGLAEGVPPEAQFARRLAENGCQVLVPVLIDRKTGWSGNPKIRMTDQPHREWIYRQAYEMGRHLIGYEVQKVLAAVDQFAGERGKAKIGVIGYGEGGLLALYAAALDPRIDAAVVSGYFQRREEVWKEPICRNVWALLHEFGDAGVASLIAPRPLIVEASRGPATTKQGSTPGELVSPPFASAKAEFDKAAAVYGSLKAQERLKLIGDGDGPPGRAETLDAFLRALDAGPARQPSGNPTADARRGSDPRPRSKRQLDQLAAFTQNLMRQSEYRRAELWSKVNHSSPEAYRKSIEPYREMFRRELIGEVPPPSAPPNPRSRVLYDQPKWTGYEVVLDVWPGVFAYGILLLPKDLKAGERRPVVVCQHGLEGRPQDVADPKANNCYHQFAAKLADRGFVVFAPQNPYIGGDNFRVLQRMANPLKCSLFSMIIRQHEAITDWLASLPFVDPDRIGFYGLSYGGKSAMRIPALVPRYCLSICSADFNEWVVKNVTTDRGYSYMLTGEYEMFEFNLGHLANYAEMAALIAPRPFMVERGHRDGVAPDEWVAYEYAKVRLRYADLKLPERTEIEFFDGPHEIHGVGTFRFLHRHLGWPEPTR